MELANHDQLEAVVEALRGMPGAKARVAGWEPLSGPDGGYDAKIDLCIGGRDLVLLVEVKKSVYPRDARQLLYQLRKAHPFETTADATVVPMVVAHSISPGAKDFLREQKIAFYDSGGSLFVTHDGVFIDVDKPPPPSEERTMRTLFTGMRARVLLALLVRHQDSFSVKELSEVAHVSPATGSEVLKALERYDWVHSTGLGPTKVRRLVAPGALLDAWVQHVQSQRPQPLRRYYLPYLAADQITNHVDVAFTQRNVDYAITGEAAAQHYAPFLTHISQVRCRLVFSERVESALKDLNARIAHEGANFAVVEVATSYDFLFRDHFEGVWYANPIHVYLDLLRGERRSREMAEHLRHERIGF